MERLQKQPRVADIENYRYRTNFRCEQCFEEDEWSDACGDDDVGTELSESLDQFQNSDRKENRGERRLDPYPPVRVPAQRDHVAGPVFSAESDGKPSRKNFDLPSARFQMMKDGPYPTRKGDFPLRIHEFRNDRN